MSGADTRAQGHGSLEQLRRKGGNIVGGVILLCETSMSEDNAERQYCGSPAHRAILHRPLTYRLAPVTIHRV
jgi:hypothetical protein